MIENFKYWLIFRRFQDSGILPLVSGFLHSEKLSFWVRKNWLASVKSSNSSNSLQWRITITKHLVDKYWAGNWQKKNYENLNISVTIQQYAPSSMFSNKLLQLSLISWWPYYAQTIFYFHNYLYVRMIYVFSIQLHIWTPINKKSDSNDITE